MDEWLCEGGRVFDGWMSGREGAWEGLWEGVWYSLV